MTIIKASLPLPAVVKPSSLYGLQQAASKGYHMEVTTKMCVNIMARQLENIGKYAGRESTTARRR
jgi:hypothetical protein